jgi:Skp family chaperone for outer membrane proteins
MKSSLVIVALGLALMAGPVYAQTPAAPATPPAQPAPAAQPPRPFPEGSKFAFVNVPRIGQESAEGKSFSAKMNALREKKQKELADKRTQLEAAQKKMDTSSSVLSESARAAQQKEVERLQVDLQRAAQDADAEVEALNRELSAEFQQKLLPVVEEVRAAKGLYIVFSLQDAGFVAIDPGLDITSDVIKKFDAAPAAPAAPAKK